MEGGFIGSRDRPGGLSYVLHCVTFGCIGLANDIVRPIYPI
jgi:hypothetical protein